MLCIGIASTSIVLITFMLTTLVDEPGTAIAIVLIVARSTVFDRIWKLRRGAGPDLDVPGSDRSHRPRSSSE